MITFRVRRALSFDIYFLLRILSTASIGLKVESSEHLQLVNPFHFEKGHLYFEKSVINLREYMTNAGLTWWDLSFGLQ